MIDKLNLRPEHYTGACSEVKAQAYYLNLGCQVYVPLVQQSGIDFLIEQDGDIFKIQVKTATWIKSGNNKYLQCRTRLTNKYQGKQPSEMYDYLVIVYEEEIWIIHSTEIKSSNISLRNTGKDECQWKENKVK